MCWVIWNWPIQLEEAKCRDAVVSHYPVKLDEEEFERIKQSRAIRYLLTPSVFAKTLACERPSRRRPICDRTLGFFTKTITLGDGNHIQRWATAARIVMYSWVRSPGAVAACRGKGGHSLLDMRGLP